ncbi:MAG: nucleotide exchange factor GrpE [Nitrososphaerota archaeon]|nr:nucleotide exchange factor GrpE [Nitrososphaerota archaeon]
MEPENENLPDNETVPQKPDLEKPDFESLLSQVDKLENELENERKKNAEQISRMKYLQADLVNMQKQADRMTSEARMKAKIDWVLEFIGIKEDLDRALISTSSEESVLITGLKLVASRIENDLKTELVEKIDVKIGDKFDPKFHDAVAFQETEEKLEGTILSVVTDGYTIGGKVLKPALIEVARKKTPQKNETPTEEKPKE